jgi:hypothetical protein
MPACPHDATIVARRGDGFRKSSTHRSSRIQNVTKMLLNIGQHVEGSFFRFSTTTPGTSCIIATRSSKMSPLRFAVMALPASHSTLARTRGPRIEDQESRGVEPTRSAPQYLGRLRTAARRALMRDGSETSPDPAVRRRPQGARQRVRGVTQSAFFTGN